MYTPAREVETWAKSANIGVLVILRLVYDGFTPHFRGQSSP